MSLMGRGFGSNEAVPEPMEITNNKTQEGIALIRAHRCAGPKERGEPFRSRGWQVYSRVLHKLRYEWVVVEFEDPERVPEGSIYREWAVIFPNRGEPKVICGRVMRVDGGFKTLPPDE